MCLFHNDRYKIWYHTRTFGTSITEIYKSEANAQTVTQLLYVARGGAVGWGTALHVGKSRVWFLMEFFSACNRNEYQEYFLGVKVAGS